MRLWLLVAVVLGCAFGALALPREARAENLVNWSYDETKKTLTIGGEAGETFDADKVFASNNDIPWNMGITGGINSVNKVVIAEANGQKIKPKSTAWWFNNATHLTSVDVSGLDASSVSNMNHMFYNCSALENLELSNLDVSNVTDMSDMFFRCSRLTTLDLSSWDVSSVVNMENMFASCSHLGTLNIATWNVSNVTNMSSLFNGCSSLLSLDVASWDVSRVKELANTFRGCKALAGIDISSWDTTSVTTTNSMFGECEALKYLDLSTWDVSETQDMSSMFYDCSKLEVLRLDSWNKNSSDNVGTMFYGCGSLRTIICVNEWEGEGTDVFKGCSSLKSFSSGASFNAGNVSATMCNPSTGYFDRGGRESGFQIEKKLSNVSSPLRAFEDAFKFEVEPVRDSDLYLYASPISLEGGETTDAPLFSKLSVVIQDRITSGASYTFKVTELQPTIPEFRDGYDPATYYLKVTIKKNLGFSSGVNGYDGLSADDLAFDVYKDEACSGPATDALRFTNAYQEPTFTPFTFRGEKLVLGRDNKTAVSPSTNTYKFLVVAGDGSSMPSGEALGRVGAKKRDDRTFVCMNNGREILFPEITCKGAGPYTYTVSEIETDKKNYPGTTYTITVIEDFDRVMDGKLLFKPIITYTNNLNEAAEEALFPACMPATFTMLGEKRPTNTSSVGAGEFAYRVSALDDESPMPDGVDGREYTCAVKGDRSIDYQPVTFYLPGRYSYGVQELPDPKNLVDYDDTSYVVTVEVTKEQVEGVYSTKVKSVTYVSDRLGEDGKYEINPEVQIGSSRQAGTVFKDYEAPRLYQAAVESGVPRHDWTGGVINKSVQYWCAAPVGKKVTIEVPAEFTVTNLSKCATLVEGSEGKPHTITWTPSADQTQISWYATPTGVSDIKVVETTAKVEGDVVDSLQYAIYHVNGSVADEYQASIAEHTERTDGIEFKETEVRRQESTADPGDQANWRSTGDAYRNAAGSEVTTSYMSDCARWSEGGDGYDAAERTKAHLEVQGATVEEPVLIPAYVFTVCTAHNFSRSVCEKNINDLLTDYGICVIKGADWRGAVRDSLVVYRSAEGDNTSKWKAYLDGLKYGENEHYTNVLPIAIKEVLFDSFAARSERASLVHDVCALYTSFDCSPSYSMVGRELVNGYMAPAWGDFNTWVVANDSFWAYLADRYVADETYFSMSELGDSKNGTFNLSVSQSDWDVWYSAPAVAVDHGDFTLDMFLQADEVGRAALMDPMNYVNAHQSRQGGTFNALYPYNRSFDECDIEPVKGTLAMEAVVRDGFTVNHIQAEHDDFVVEANVTGDPASGYALTSFENRGNVPDGKPNAIEAASEDGKVKLRLVLDGQKATVYALGHESEDPENIRLNIDANVDHAKVPEGTWFDTYAGNPRLAWSGQQIIDIKPPILGLAGPDLTLEKVQVGEDATSASGSVEWTKNTITLDPFGTLSYSFKLENSGKVAATNVYIEDYLPEGLTLSDATIKAINAQRTNGKESFWVEEERHFKYYVAESIEAGGSLDLTAGVNKFIVVTKLPDEENAVYANSATATANELPDPVESNTVIATTGSHAEWEPFAEKKMGAGVLQEGQFSFRLWTEGKSAETLAPMPLGATTTTDGEGKAVSEITVKNGKPAEGSKGRVDFGTIVFTEAKTYTYYLQEVVPTSATADKPIDGVTYDTHVYKIVVEVEGGSSGLAIKPVTVSKYKAEDLKSTGTTKATDVPLATFKNSATGSLEISKQVVGTEAQQKQDFTFEIQLSDTSFNKTLSEVAFSGGKATVTLHHGESKLIEGLPAGMGYAVTETADSGFTTTSTGSEGSIPVGGTAKAAFTNIAKGALTITKVVKGTTNPDDLARKFTFTVTLSEIPGDSGFTADTYGDLKFEDAGNGTFTATCELADGESVTATGLPEGAHYKVEEDSAEGFVPTLTDAKGTILATGFVNVQATNTKEAGNLVVYKTVPPLDANVPGVDPSDQLFEITVTLEDSEYNGKYGEMHFVDGVAKFKLKSGEQLVASGIPAGMKYTVRETAASGYTTEYRGETGEISAGATERATVTNNITTGSLKVSKTVVPEGGALTNDKLAQEFIFTVTLYKPTADGTKGEVAADINGSYPGAYPDSVGRVEFENGEATFKLKHGESVTINQLPPGYFYTVAENDASDYTAASTGSEGQIPANGTATASFVNTHGEPTTASLVVRKTVKGSAALGAKFDFTVTLTGSGAAGVNGDHDGVTFDGGKASFQLQADEERVITGLPVGCSYTVEETPNGALGEYRVTKTGDTGELTADTVAEASFTNDFSKSGSLSITKRVEGLATGTSTWEFTIELTGEGAEGVTGYFSNVLFEAGEATVFVAGNDTKLIEGLPAGLGYEVSETKANTDGYTTVSENAIGTIPADGTANAAFTNTKTVPFTPQVRKQVVDGEEKVVDDWGYSTSPFIFTLKSDSNAPLPSGAEALTQRTDADGIATWPEITYREAGTYTYQVRETAGALAGMGYDTTEHTLTVEVAADGNITQKWDGESATPTITNTYAPKITVPLSLTKQVVDANGNAISWDYGATPFSFKISATDDAPLPSNTTATTSGETGTSSKVTWPEIAFTKAGTYTYKVKETTESSNRVLCDETEYTVTVVVSGGGAEPLAIKSVTWSWEGGSTTSESGPTVSNQAVGALKISKKLEGENVDVDEDREWNFTITLTKADESPLSGTFDGVEFGTDGEAIVQLKGGESREIKGIPAGARYTVVEQEADVAPYSTTSVGAESTIQTGKTAEAAFTNTKAEAKTTPALVDIKKTVISAGNAKSIAGHVFSFRVTPDARNPEGDPLARESRTVTTPGVALGNTETVELFDHEFSQAGTYRYTVSEVTGADPAISYDDRTFTVEVKITPGSYDAEHNLYPLLAKATIKDAEDKVLAEGGDGTSKAKLEVEFENTYNVNEITVPLRAHKTLEGEGMKLKPGDFTFELTAAEGTPLPEGVTAPIKASNDATSYVKFGSVTFHETGTFTYTIHEVIPADVERVSGMTYDESVWDVMVEVKANGGDGLSAEVTYSQRGMNPEVTNSDAAEFVNSYEPPTPPPPPSEGAPALAVSKTHGLNDDAFEHSHTLVNEVVEGDVVTYFVKVENTGDGKATNVTVRDVVPEGLELVGNSISEGGSVGSDGRTITWSLGTLGAGESRVVSFGARVPAVDAETTWTNVASAWAEEVPDPKATNVVMEHATPPENPPGEPDEPDEPDNPPDTPPDTPSNPGTPDTPSTPDTPGNPGTPGAPSEPKSPEMAIPKTGDDTPLTLALLLGVAGVSLLAATLALLLRRRRT